MVDERLYFIRGAYIRDTMEELAKTEMLTSALKKLSPLVSHALHFVSFKQTSCT